MDPFCLLAHSLALTRTALFSFLLSKAWTIPTHLFHFPCYLVSLAKSPSSVTHIVTSDSAHSLLKRGQLFLHQSEQTTVGVEVGESWSDIQ